MDMNFPHRLKDQVTGPISLLGDNAPDLSILIAVASARQAASPTARCIAADADETRAERDVVGALAQIFAPRRAGRVKAASLAGCFNPLIAGYLGGGTGSDDGAVPAEGPES